MNLFGGPRRVSLRTKFVVPISLILVGSMLVISGFLIKKQSESFRRELATSGKTMLRILAINAESGVLFESKYELDELLKAPSRFEAVRYAIITNHDGRVLSQFGTRDTSAVFKDGTAQVPLEDSVSVWYSTRTDRELMILSMPVVTHKKVLDREHLGITGGLDNSFAYTDVTEVIGFIELGMSLEKVNQSIREAQTAAILFSAAIVILTILLIALIVGAVTKPITALVEATDQISRGDLSRRVEVKRNDEIGHLAETFNKMIGSLKQSRDEIEAYNRNLEQKIIERTRQLEETQAQLVQSEKMSAIGQLAAGVAHELNNPLGGILGYAQFTLEKLQKNVPEKTTAKEIQSYVRYLTDIETQSRRCKTIVQNLLRFSRSSRTVDFEEVDVNRAIEDTVTFVEHQLHLNQIELEVTLAPDLPLIQGNTGQLQQVFTNLIINAMHASPPNSVISVISRYSRAIGEFGGAVEVLVGDHGCGIKEEHLKRIFEPFFTTKDVGKGTGLGLSVSYGIVKDHGGEIAVTSKPGEGSTFTVVLPVQKTESATDTKGVRQPSKVL
ncbi:MAG: ATP-binding protein [Candidatus Zixiibacteriota bacterium]